MTHTLLKPGPTLGGAVLLLTMLPLLLLAGHSSRLVSANISVSQDSDQYDNLEAVLETNKGEIVIELFPKDAPKHVEYFVKQARDGAYDGTIFHRAIKYGIIQGGDPLTRNPR